LRKIQKGTDAHVPHRFDCGTWVSRLLFRDAESIVELNLAEERNLDNAVEGIARKRQRNVDILAGQHLNIGDCMQRVAIFLFDLLDLELRDRTIHVELKAIFAAIVRNRKLHVALEKHRVNMAAPVTNTNHRSLTPLQQSADCEICQT